MKFNDIDYNNNIYKDDYPVKPTNQSVSGLSLAPTYPSSSVPLSSNVISSSPSPITLCTDCDNSKLLLILS